MTAASEHPNLNLMTSLAQLTHRDALAKYPFVGLAQWESVRLKRIFEVYESDRSFVRIREPTTSFFSCFLSEQFFVSDQPFSLRNQMTSVTVRTEFCSPHSFLAELFSTRPHRRPAIPNISHIAYFSISFQTDYRIRETGI